MSEGPTRRIDERDTMFARMEREAGTAAYADFYARRREWKAVDDRLRSMPPLLDPRGRHYDADVAKQTAAYFEAIEGIEVDEAWAAREGARLAGAEDATAWLRAMTLDLGAAAVGATALDPAFVYTHKGRFDDDYGVEVHLAHEHVLVFLVEMDHARMRRAPLAETLLESARQYWRAAVIAKRLTAVLEAAGHAAKAHYDAHYDLVLPPLAAAAGLGEVGRNNILIADRFGSRVRIGAVTTNLALRHDVPVSLGVERFCGVCLKCAENCPSHALSVDDKELVNGTRRWPTNVERCHGWWRQAGTDCGVCMVACPFSHQDNAFHNLVRRIVRRMPWSHRLLVWFDDLLYGRTWKPSAAMPPPPDDVPVA